MCEKVSWLSKRLRGPGWGWGCFGVACTVVFCGVFLASSMAAGGASRQVLLIYDERTDLPGLGKIDAGLVGGIRTGSRERVDIFREALDLSRFDSLEYRKLVRDFLRGKYRTKKLDVVVAVMEPALRFLLADTKDLFPGVPIVFCGIDQRAMSGLHLSERVTGVLLKREFAPTLSLALKLHPETRGVAVVSGTSEFDRQLLEQACQEFRTFENRVSITYYTNQSLGEMIGQLARLPRETVILYCSMFRDGAGAAFVPHDAVERISAAVNVPIYVFLDQYVGYGAVGGQVYSLGSHGEAAADLVLQILAGKSPTELPLLAPKNTVPRFDSRELKRWKISEARLPAGSSILFRQPSLWDQYRTWIITGLSVLAAQGVLISTLIMNLVRRRRAEASLCESEARMKLAAMAADLRMWDWDMASDRVWVAGRARDGKVAINREESDYSRFLQTVHPADRDAVALEVAKSMNGAGDYDHVHRTVGRDGRTRWITARGRVEFDKNHKPVRMRGVSMDITGRKEAEEELAHVSRVSTLGELGGSLAHELNQPLAAILSNAQAAIRFLNSGTGTANLSEVREILQDIVEEDKRAGQIIVRMRAMLKKEHATLAPQDLNQIVSEVLGIMHSELLLRNATSVTKLGSQLPLIKGDRIRLQQVLVNLVVNACDAMITIPPPKRQVTIETERLDENFVQLSVGDCGPGFVADGTGSMFEPFRSSKPNGLGLGLPICRSIIESHGGRFWVANHPAGGAIVRLTLLVEK